MIPRAFITEWKKFAPWTSNYQVEQDLIIERALVEIFSEDELKKHLAFRGGTSLHKLYLKPQVRYSEDIDLVQIEGGNIGDVLTLVRNKLDFLGEANFKKNLHNSTLTYKINSDFEPVIGMKLKIEINTREHFSVFGFQDIDFEIKNDWFSGKCKITSYMIEELLSTKLRALYQRRKGRDLFDLWYAYSKTKVNTVNVITGFKEYLAKEEKSISQNEFTANMKNKIKDSAFLGDITALIRPEIEYDQDKAWEFVKDEIVSKL